MIVIITGLPGSGKSYFAGRIAQMLSAAYINSDKVRRELLVLPSYSCEEKILVYDEMLKRAIQASEHGKEVVIDATFCTNALRKKFTNELQKISGVFFIEMVADEDVIKERLMQRSNDSDADFNVYKSVKKLWEPVSGSHLVLKSTNDNINDLLEETADYLFIEMTKRNDQGLAV